MKILRYGFTLIELVMVIVVLAILSAIVIPAFQNFQKNAKDATTKAALTAMREAIKIYIQNEMTFGRDCTGGAFPDNCCPDRQLRDEEQTGANSPVPPFVMESAMLPENPWFASRVGEGATPSHSDWIQRYYSEPVGRVYPIGGATNVGWIYDANNCTIWANSKANGGTAHTGVEPPYCDASTTTENCF